MNTASGSLRFWGCGFALLLFCCGSFVTAQTVTFNDRTSTATGDSTVRGRAIYDDNEKPVRRARVVLLSNRTSEARTSVTDINGEFTFKKVAAGEYRVLVDFPGYTNGGGTRVEGLPATTVTVDGTSSVDVRLRAIRGASITGKVSYPDGEPAVGAQVNVFVKVGNRWEHAALVSRGAETDDRGIYRIYPLQAGEYIVSVIEQSMVLEERDGRVMQTVGNMSVTPYFYADASSLKNAKVIQVETGREVNNINLTLAERATYEVSGTITVSEKPLIGAYLRLQTRDDGMGGPTLDRPYGLSTRSDKSGHWSFTDVPDGEYQVELDPTAFLHRDSPPNGYINASKRVSVMGADVPDVVIAVTEAGKISGTIVVEGDKPLPDGIYLYAELAVPEGQRAYGSSSSANPQTPGTFLLEGVHPGENRLTVGLGRQDYYVKSVTWANRNLMSQTVKVESGREVQGVRVVLSTEVGSLTGRIVSLQNKEPLAQTTFMLAPTDITKWNSRQSFLSGRTDNAGRFTIKGAPGDYLVIVVPKEVRSFDDLKKLAPEAQRVTLKTTSQSEVEIAAP